MKINFFSITFWFNIFNNHTSFLDVLREKLGDEFTNFNIKNIDNNLMSPVINAVNNEKMTNINISQINLQYNMDNVSLNDLEEFRDKSLKLLEVLTLFNIEVLHTAIFINGEISCEDAIERITKNIINKNMVNEDLVDAILKFGKKEEDLFYKIIGIGNKKQIKIQNNKDNLGRVLPLPLISLNGSFTENEIIDISYEINDKYSFDFTKDYHTTEFYLNKMLYLLINNFESDIDNLIEKGNF